MLLFARGDGIPSLLELCEHASLAYEMQCADSEECRLLSHDRRHELHPAVVEKIHTCETNHADRPLKDVVMEVVIV